MDLTNIVVIVDDNEKEIKLKSFGYECYSTNGQIKSVLGFKNPDELIFQLKEDYEWLQKKTKNKKVYLGMSNSSAGENIAWDISYVLNENSKYRIYLSTLTREGVLKSFSEPPKEIRRELVDEYQKKLLEDYRFAFTISPLMWKCMSNTYEKKLTINKTQFEVLEKIVSRKNYPLKYKLKGYFTKKFVCFECLTTFETFEQVKEAGEKIKNLIPVVETTTTFVEEPLTLKKLSEEFFIKDIYDGLKSLYYKGLICECNNEEDILRVNDMDAIVDESNLLNKNEKLLYKYILKKNVEKESTKRFIKLGDYIFVGLGEIKPLITLNGLRTEVVQNNEFYLEEELRALDYKGFVNISRKVNSSSPVEYVEMDFFSGSQEIKTINVRAFLEPLGYMVYQFITLKDYEKKFEIKIDEKHSCIVGKYGLVVRNNETSTFIRMKESYDYEALFFQRCKVEDVATITINNSAVKKEYIFFGGKEVVLKKGKYGLYAQVGGKQNVSLKELGNRPIENIQKEEVLKILEKSLKNNY
jgi:hypothetical protein